MISFIEDLGMHYKTPQSKRKERTYLVLCSGCNKEYEMQANQFNAGYTEYCKECHLNKKKENK